MNPWSALGKTGRPDGYSRAQVNAMGVAPALQITGWQREEDRHREAIIAKPGRKVLEITKPRAVTHVETCYDDGIKELSEGRFLRPPQSATDFWSRVPLDYPVGERQHWREYTGTRYGTGCRRK